ncbi:MAG: hypothetical protein IJC09_06790 [Clostridia bacterium]|nr:hypothetical protein [Clostridia bacterium]
MKKRIDNDKIFDAIEIDMGNNAVSHTETTGLIPALADNDYKMDSYREIQNFEQRPISRRKRYHNP